MSDTDSEATQSDLRNRALDAFEDFSDACEAVENEDPATRLRTEAEAIDNFTEEVGKCYAEGFTEMTIGQFASMVKDVSNTLNKTEAKQQIATATQNAKNASKGRERMTDWIDANLQEVRIIRTTDHIQETRYVWDFNAVTLETGSGEESRTHYHWGNFRDSIHEAGGPYLADPPDGLREMNEWREWIVELLEERNVEKTNVGPRTLAVRDLQNQVRNVSAFETLEAAINYGGVHAKVNNDPPDGAEPVDTDTAPQRLPEWRVDVLYIPNGWAVDAAEDNGTTTRALQNEIDSRGYMLNSNNKIATREYVDGEVVTFWVVDGDFAAPNTYQPEGEEQTGAEGMDTETNTTDETDTIGGFST